MRDVHTRATKEAILRAAMVLFSARGFTETGVRDIARKARVNQALIARYFGSKIELYAEVLREALDISHFTSTSRAVFGEQLAQSFCTSPPDAAAIVPLLIYAAGDSSAREVALGLLVERVINPLGIWFGEPEAAERAAQFLTVVTGFFIYRLMLPIDTIAASPSPAMQRWLAQALQEIIDRP
jgi:AcrR family transcriptional regulator